MKIQHYLYRKIFFVDRRSYFLSGFYVDWQDRICQNLAQLGISASFGENWLRYNALRNPREHWNNLLAFAFCSFSYLYVRVSRTSPNRCRIELHTKSDGSKYIFICMIILVLGLPPIIFLLMFTTSKEMLTNIGTLAVVAVLYLAGIFYVSLLVLLQNYSLRRLRDSIIYDLISDAKAENVDRRPAWSR